MLFIIKSLKQTIRMREITVTVTKRWCGVSLNKRKQKFGALIYIAEAMKQRSAPEKQLCLYRKAV
jgi:hypothetical protein